MPKGHYDHNKQRHNIVGKKFGRLTVKEYHHSNDGAFWTCVCDCGNTRVVSTHSLKSGHTKSCGCYNRERSSEYGLGRRKGNIVEVEGSIVRVKMTNCDEYFICDICDLGLVERETWRKSDTGYAVRGKSKTFHNELMSPPKGMVVDHINRNKLDNRRCNLRVVSQRENTQNTGDISRGASGVKGVSKNKNTGKYIAEITMNKKRIRIGTFFTIEEAAKARKNKEIELNFGGIHK